MIQNKSSVNLANEYNTDHSTILSIINRETWKHLCLDKELKESLINAKSNHKFIKAKGNKNGNSKLTEQQIIEIRKKYIPKITTMSQIAHEYNVSKSLIRQIIRNIVWKHI